MSHLFEQKNYLSCFLLLVMFALSACGGGGGGSADNSSSTGGGNGSGGGGTGTGSGADPVLERIVVDTPSIMFTTLGDVHSLSATAFNSDGDQVNVTLNWQSSNNNQINIDSDSGVVTAIANGAAVLTASAEGVTSNPVVAVVAQFQPGVILVAPDQVLSEPQLAGNNPDPVVYQVGLQFSVSLSNTAAVPQIGSVLAANGEIPFAGRVVAVAQDADGHYQTTLEIIAIHELLADFQMDEVIQLLNLPATINPDLDTYFAVEKKPNGEIVLTPREEKLSIIARPEFAYDGLAAKPPLGTAANRYHPFVCDTAPSGLFDPNNIPIRLELGSNAIKITPDISVPLIYNSDRGLEKIALRGEVKAEAKLKFAFTAAFEAKFSCRLQIAVINIPLPGALGFLVGAQVPIGIGGEAGGKIKLADVGVEKEATASATVEYGYFNPPSCDTTVPDPDPDPDPDDGEGDGPPLDRSDLRSLSNDPVCGFNGTLVTKGEIKTNYDRLNTGKTFETLGNDITLEPKATGFGYAALAVGNPYLSVLSAELLVINAGPALSANLATANGQILNETYKSNYALSMEGVLKPGKTVENALKFFKVAVSVKPELKIVQPLTTSPKARSLTIGRDTSTYTAGEVLTFRVVLDETSVNFFPGLHNVSDILVYQKSSDPNQAARRIASASDSTIINPGDAQLIFDIDWTADANGDAKDQFYAFVTTPLLPVPVLNELELGKFVVSNGKIQLDHFRQEARIICTWFDTSQANPCDGAAGVNTVVADSKVSETLGQSQSDAGMNGGSVVLTSSVTNDGDQGVYELVADLSGGSLNGCELVGAAGHCVNPEVTAGLAFYTAETLICDIEQNITDLFGQVHTVSVVGPGFRLQYDVDSNPDGTIQFPSDNELILDGDKDHNISLYVFAATDSVQVQFKMTCNAPFE